MLPQRFNPTGAFKTYVKVKDRFRILKKRAGSCCLLLHQCSWYPFALQHAFGWNTSSLMMGTCPLGWCCTARILLGQKSREETEPINPEALLGSIRTKIKRRIWGVWEVFISASTHWLCQSRHPHLTTHRMGSAGTISQSPQRFICNKTSTERSQRLYTPLPHAHPCLAYFASVFSRARRDGKWLL